MYGHLLEKASEMFPELEEELPDNSSDIKSDDPAEDSFDISSVSLSQERIKASLSNPSGTILSEWGHSKLKDYMAETLPEDALADVPPSMELTEQSSSLRRNAAGIYRISDAVSVDSSLVVKRSATRDILKGKSFEGTANNITGLKHYFTSITHLINLSRAYLSETTTEEAARDVNFDLDFLASVQSSTKPPVDPFSTDTSLLSFPSITATTQHSVSTKTPSRSTSPAHPKLSPAAAAFIRSLPDLSYMLGPPGVSEARE